MVEIDSPTGSAGVAVGPRVGATLGDWVGAGAAVGEIAGAESGLKVADTAGGVSVKGID